MYILMIGKREVDNLRHSLLKNNKGYSLVELIVVISIMTILTGVLSLGISLMFSRDAESAAKIIADSMTKARTYSMSKPGNYTMIIHQCASGSNNSSDTDYNYIEIKNDIADATDGAYSEIVTFDTRAQICAPSGSDYATPSDGDEIVIIFNKTNGSVKSINDGVGYNGSDISSSQIYTVKCIATRNTAKTSIVKLMTVTGRNSIE